ncbi:MAG: TetR/AcrR family transcriptional regulator [Polyangiaceae bacterium]
MFIEPSGPGKRKEQKAETRARILDVARRSLEEVGFEATSIRDVARAAGVAPGTVLLHFPDKRDLLHAALFDGLEEVSRRVRKPGPRSSSKARSLESALTGVARAFYAYYAERPALSRALLRESLFAAPPWSQRFATQVGEVHAHVVALAAGARDRGELDASVDADVLGAAFLSFYYFALLAWIQGSHDDPTRLFRRLLAQHLRAAAPKARSSAKKKGAP